MDAVDGAIAVPAGASAVVREHRPGPRRRTRIWRRYTVHSSARSTPQRGEAVLSGNGVPVTPSSKTDLGLTLVGMEPTAIPRSPTRCHCGHGPSDDCAAACRRRGTQSWPDIVADRRCGIWSHGFLLRVRARPRQPAGRQPLGHRGRGHCDSTQTESPGWPVPKASSPPQSVSTLRSSPCFKALPPAECQLHKGPER